MFSMQIIKTALVAGVVVVLGGLLVAQPFRAPATASAANPSILGKWLVMNGADATTATMVTFQGNTDGGAVIVSGRAGVLGPATGEWMRINGNEFVFKTYAVRATE